MADQLDLWERPDLCGMPHKRPEVPSSCKTCFTFSDAAAAPVLIVEDLDGAVRFTVEGQPPRRYGPGLGRMPRRGR